MRTYLFRIGGYVEDDLWAYTGSVQKSISTCDHLPTPTNILDKNGDMIYKSPRPIGFGRHDEW